MLKYCTCVRKNIFSAKPMNKSAVLWSSYRVLGQNHQKKIERFENASLAGSMAATLSQKRVAFASASDFRHFATINSWFSWYLNVAQEPVLPQQVSEVIIFCILGREWEFKVAFMSANGKISRISKVRYRRKLDIFSYLTCFYCSEKQQKRSNE